MAFELKDFSQEELAAADKRFQGKTEFVLGVAKLEQLPADSLPEVAFAGRSNVGKSSIINAVTGQKGLAKTSNTPGRTQQLNFFNFDQSLYIVDLPGYGYAQAPEAQVRQWQKGIFAYLQGRVSLKRVFLLIDGRHGIKKVDEEVMEMLDKAAVTYQIVLTKADKVSQTQIEETKTNIEKTLGAHPAAYNRVLITSSEKRKGIDILRAEIAEIILQN